jgi:solute carrier family 35, member E3
MQTDPSNVATWQRQVTYLLVNVVSATAIVFANKTVFSVYRFDFTVALTFVHTFATWAASKTLVTTGFISPKKLPWQAVCSLAFAFAGYICLSNASLLLNSVGFYQLTKIAITPAVLIIECYSERRVPDLQVTAAIVVVCAGIGIATVLGDDVVTNLPGIIVGLASTLVSAKYGIWIGTMTKHYAVNPLQLLEQYIPAATGIMAFATLVSESLDLQAAIKCLAGESANQAIFGDSMKRLTLFTYAYTLPAITMIVTSALLGVIVTFSTFLTISATSALTYSVSGHIKTVLIFAGGVILFGEHITPAKLCGIVMALVGIIAYSLAKSKPRPDPCCVCGPSCDAKDALSEMTK